MNKILFTLLLGLAISVPSMAGAVPAFPMNFWGTVTINGDNAPIGTVVGAYNAADTLIAQFTVTYAGAYGSEDRTVVESAKLSISDYSDAGAGLTFKFNSPSYDNNAILTGTDTQSYAGVFSAENHQNQNLAFTGANPHSSVVSIAITAPSYSVVAGSTRQFTATATYYDTSTANITTSCTWSSSASAASIGVNTGLATGSSAGSATITASYEDATNGVLSDTAVLTVTAAPGGTVAPSGGGGSTATVSMPTTTTGAVTATKRGGGMTTITTTDGGKASVKLPAYAVSANTKVSVESKVATSEGLGSAFAVMTGDYTIIGENVYEITASADGSDVTEFSKKLTITLTYTDAQIAGLTETSLTISYWDVSEEKWFALPTTVDKATNTLTALTDHLTYFAILSGLGESVVVDDDVVKPVSEMTQAEIRAAIAEIIVKIKQLQAILAQMRGESVGVSGCAITSFDRALKSGMSGTDVKCLQLILNSAADTQIASSGVGSPGQETNYFGGLTKAGVTKFQEKYATDVLAPHGLTTGTGYVGTTTRAKLNTLLK